MQTQRVVAAIIQSDDRFLVARRASHKAMAGKWEFPGGKPEAGESDETALVREIREELGVEIKVLRHFDTSITYGIELACYVCELTSPKPKSSTDHDELRWLPEADLSKLDWAEADRPALKRLLIPFC
jgi:8-oxo-dGTP diphosphatase